MRKSWIRVLMFLACLAQPAFAQLQLGVKFAHGRFVQFEPVTAALTVINKTGKTLILGETGGEIYIRFEIRDAGGAYVQPRPSAPALVMLVGSGQTATTNVDVREYYKIDKPGAYTVVPMLVTASRTYLASKTFLDVVSGVVAAEMDLDVNGSPRHYSLLQCSRDRQDDLFLRIDDRDSGLCYGVWLLGNILSFQPPHMEVDEEDRLHVIHQPHPAYLTHHVFSLDGALIRRASYSRSGEGELLDDQDHLELLEDESNAVTPSTPAAPRLEAVAAEIPAPAIDPVRESERAEADVIMQDIESIPVAVSAPASAKKIQRTEALEQAPKSAPAVMDPLQEPVGR